MTTQIHISITDAADPAKLDAVLEEARTTGRVLVVDPEGEPAPAVLDVQDRGMRITHADAQDSMKYRRAKQLAAEAGQTLIIDPPIMQPVTHAPETVIIPKNASPQVYRRMRDAAIAKGVEYAVAEA